MSGDSVHVYDVIVIGAGASGLSGAKLLTENGIDILVLEAKDRVGGRTWTVKNSNVGWVDLGGAYVGRTQNHLLRLIKEFGLKLYPVNEVEKLVYYNNFTGQRALFNFDSIPRIDFLTLLDFNHVLRLLDEMGQKIPADEPWKAPKAEEWDRKTFWQFLEENTITKGSRDLFRIILANIVTNEHYESSLLWFAWYVKQCQGTKSIMATKNGAQEFKVSGGTNQISERLADCVGTERVLLQHAVYYIEQKEDNDLVVLKTVNGKEFHSKYVIMATPPAVQQKIHYQPALPALRNQLIQRAPMGAIMKCIVYYKKPFWRSKDMCGSLVLIGDDYKYPIPITLDDTKGDGSFPAIIGFIPADKARKVVNLSKEDRLQVICKSFAKAFHSKEAQKPIYYEEFNWMEDQYCGGGYTMTCPPGFLTRFGPTLHQPVGRIYFAGTECASQWSGYINGAIQAGERAARQVLLELGHLSKDQVDQLEPDSVEYPPVPYVRDFFEQNAPSAKRFLHGAFITSVAAFSLGLAYFGSFKFGFRIALPFRL